MPNGHYTKESHEYVVMIDQEQLLRAHQLVCMQKTPKGDITYYPMDRAWPRFALEPTTQVCYRVCSSRRRTRNLVNKLTEFLDERDIRIRKLPNVKAA